MLNGQATCHLIQFATDLLVLFRPSGFVSLLYHMLFTSQIISHLFNALEPEFEGIAAFDFGEFNFRATATSKPHARLNLWLDLTRSENVQESCAFSRAQIQYFVLLELVLRWWIYTSTRSLLVLKPLM